jgi:hypothetical protein
MGAPSTPGFALNQTFFGFNASHQVVLHQRLFELIWAGEGRWTWDDIYHLPIRVRKLWITNINKMRTEHNEEIQKQVEKNRNSAMKHKTPTTPPVAKK